VPAPAKKVGILTLGPVAKMDPSEGKRASDEGGEDVTGKAFMRAFRQAVEAGSDSAALSAFKDLCTHCAQKGGGHGSEGEESAESS
jgi:hypothetical protein